MGEGKLFREKIRALVKGTHNIALDNLAEFLNPVICLGQE